MRRPQLKNGVYEDLMKHIPCDDYRQNAYSYLNTTTSLYFAELHTPIFSTLPSNTPAANMLPAMVVLTIMWLTAFPSLSQGCQRSCGNVSIPYPFGLDDDPKCFRDGRFALFCNTSYNPSQLFLGQYSNIPIQELSLNGHVNVTIRVARDCYDEDGETTGNYYMPLKLTKGYRFSNTQNKLVAIGCDTVAYVSDFSKLGFQGGCNSYCNDKTSVGNGSCDGIGCCTVQIPENVITLNVSVESFRNHKQCWSFNPCSYAFLADKDWFQFYTSDLSSFEERVEQFHEWPCAPVVLDWAIGDVNCTEAKKDQKNYACGLNTACSDSNNGPGYLCHCNDGYEGNPYDLQHGCQDINECDRSSEDSPCEGRCSNTPGSYTCSCPFGQLGDGRREGSGCTAMIPLALVTGSFLLSLVLVTSWICCCLQKRKVEKLKKKFFHQNGGTILQQKLSAHDTSLKATKLFTSEELKAATDNYNESLILGQGGYGIVYRGILPDERVVAIKKSKIADKEQTEQFINEVIILSQINHRHVVKLLGCCLETENPLLVYEFVNNGTLDHHIHDEGSKYTISWSNRLRIAADTAEAIAYLHSSASQPIIHRDIKSANILLDEYYNAKVADFGASRLISLDQTQLSTLVQGTRGYLDPEYLKTSLLTEKSDVYSFGVVLAELLTGRKALCFDKPEEERNLANFFVSSLKAKRLFEVIEHHVVSEGSSDQLQDVANLAGRCLRMNSEERPTMKEVAAELEGMIISERHAWTEQNPGESDYLLGEVAGCHDNNPGYENHSIRDQVTHSLHIGR